MKTTTGIFTQSFKVGIALTAGTLVVSSLIMLIPLQSLLSAQAFLCAALYATGLYLAKVSDSMMPQDRAAPRLFKTSIYAGICFIVAWTALKLF